MNPIIDAKQIIKSFGYGEEKVVVLKKVSLQVNAGEFIAIMGASGSGKSTLLYTLSAIEDLDSGEVIIEQNELSTLNEDQKADMRRKKFGFVFQNPTMLKNLNIIDNIILQAAYEKNTDKNKLIAEAKVIMAKTGIDGLENRSITEVSGGQLQRAGICRAILHKPSIIFADEPTGALDSKSGEDIMKLFSNIHKEGMTILLVTHDSKVASIVDKVLFMKDGEIKEETVLKSSTQEDKINEIEEVIKRVL
ncbi:MAG: ABC transporter ATP-binding protein [Tissierellia bacterium]|nr:ABC transporter ATP-binding protein [Tissierellia bacterium]